MDIEHLKGVFKNPSSNQRWGWERSSLTLEVVFFWNKRGNFWCMRGFFLSSVEIFCGASIEVYGLKDFSVSSYWVDRRDIMKLVWLRQRSSEFRWRKGKQQRGFFLGTSAWKFLQPEIFFGAEIIIHEQIRALVTEIQIEAALSIFQW